MNLKKLRQTQTEQAQTEQAQIEESYLDHFVELANMCANISKSKNAVVITSLKNEYASHEDKVEAMSIVYETVKFLVRDLVAEMIQECETADQMQEVCDHMDRFKIPPEHIHIAFSYAMSVRNKQ